MTKARPVRLDALCRAVLLAAACAAGLPAAAQIIDLGPGTPDEPNRGRQTAPAEPPRGEDPARSGTPTPADPALRERSAPARAAAPDGASAAEDWLVPLQLAAPAHEPGAPVRLTGETATARFALVLPAAPSGETVLQLVHRSGIDVLRDRSALRVSVNGTLLATLEPDNFDQPGADTIAVPAGLLQAGLNRVTVDAAHTHRVSCGVEASFALWTEIEARRSGVAMPAAAFGTDTAGFIAAATAQTAAGQPLRLLQRAADAPPPEALAGVLAALAARMPGPPPQLALSAPWIVAGPAPDHARIALVPDEIAPQPFEVRRGGDGAVVLVMTSGADPAPVVAALRDAPGIDPGGQGRLPALPPGRPVPLRALGHEGLGGTGHYILVPIRFRLPEDWLLLANQKARLDLDYRFVRGLPEGALLQVKVNGTTIRLLPLDRGGGTALPTLPVDFPARLLRPGANRLDFEALIPGALPDQACPPMPDPALEISGGSRLSVPSAPRMSLGDVATALGSLGASSIEPTDQARAALPAATPLQLAMALDALRSPGAADGAGTLMLALPSDLAALYPTYGRDAIAALQAALRPAPRPGADGAPAVTTEAMPEDPWAAFEDGWRPPLAKGWLQAAWTRAGERLTRAVRAGDQPLENWLEGRRATALLLQPDPERPGALWLVPAPQSDAAQLARAVAAGATRFDGPRGQVALLGGDGSWTSWRPAMPRLRLHGRVTPANLTAVAGNFATAAPLYYVAAMLGLAALSATVALAMLLVLRGARR